MEEQASNIDDTPVHNSSMERQCCKGDYRLQKLGTLPAVSRSIILRRSQQLKEGKNSLVRGSVAAALTKREVELSRQRLAM